MADTEEAAGVVITACPMNAYSYSEYSAYQRGVVEKGNKLMLEAIRQEAVELIKSTPATTTFRIADFGCSVGPTTFITVQNIIEAVVMSLLSANDDESVVVAEFQVFFNDQTDNDFNALFRSLPNHHRQGNVDYFAAGVPGSFYGRLFPKGSLHFGHISSSLHWLSRVPGDVVESRNHINGDEQVTVNAGAYRDQFQMDMEAFFHARAEELVAGGLLQISALCLPDGVALTQTGLGFSFDLFRDSLLDVTNLGLISEEKMESFYLPMHYPQISELEAMIKKKGRFSIQKMEKTSAKSPERIQLLVPHLRAVLEGLVKQHFEATSQAMDSIFERFADHISNNMSTIMNPAAMQQHLEVFILAKRL